MRGENKGGFRISELQRGCRQTPLLLAGLGSPRASSPLGSNAMWLTVNTAGQLCVNLQK